MKLKLNIRYKYTKYVYINVQNISFISRKTLWSSFAPLGACIGQIPKYCIIVMFILVIYDVFMCYVVQIIFLLCILFFTGSYDESWWDWNVHVRSLRIKPCDWPFQADAWMVIVIWSTFICLQVKTITFFSLNCGKISGLLFAINIPHLLTFYH